MNRGSILLSSRMPLGECEPWEAFITKLQIPPLLHSGISLLASSPVWASKTGLARTRERAAKPRGASLARSREARFACPNRKACSQAIVVSVIGQSVVLGRGVGE